MYSVSVEGAKFLRSCRPDHQPPLLLPITSELGGGNEDKISTDTPGSGIDGMSQVGILIRGGYSFTFCVCFDFF